jgi:glyoxylase-like metal-dependent hydrolase (beta-lactamase superfamily II)
VSRFERLASRLFLFRDVCNVYVITSGRRALLVDAGSGAVLEHLDELGVSHVDWVVHTHHHRDQCAGTPRIAASGAQVAVPAHEASYFEDAEGLWNRQEIFDVYDCTNVWDRPRTSIPVDARLEDYETHRWEDIELLALPAPGHTKWSLAYLAKLDGERWLFSGDLIHSPGRVHTLHDLHWDYSDPDGLDAALHTIHILRRRGPDALAPSHGEPMREADSALAALALNLQELLAVCGGRYVGDLHPALGVEHRIEQVSEHLVAVTHTSANFYVLRGDDGAALLFDYGFPSFLGHVSGAERRFVEHTLPELRERFGVERIEVLVPTHYHDDHVSGAQFLHERFGTKVWAFETFANVLREPAALRLPAVWRHPLVVDRVIREGETVEWRGFSFVAHHLPGHTWYAACFLGEVDGLRVAVSGDQIQLDGQGRLRGGGPVYQNGLEPTSFSEGTGLVRAYEPHVLLTGHDGPLLVNIEQLDEVLAWCHRLEAAFVELAASPDAVGFALDPTWTRIVPYRTQALAGDTISVRATVRNHGPTDAGGSVRLVPPEGWHLRPHDAALHVAAGALGEAAFELEVPATAARGTHVITAKVSLGGRDAGEVAEALVRVGN